MYRPYETPDGELLAVIRSEPRGSPAREAACEKLVRRYEALVGSCAARYRDSPEPFEELMQAGYVGLLKAINNFDPAIGESLAAYAVPCITGELKRHFRDRRWQVHVRRGAQELRLEYKRAASDLAQQLSRMPTDAEVADYLGVNAAQLADAQHADRAFIAESLSTPLSGEAGSDTLADLIGQPDPDLESRLAMDAVWQHLPELPERQQRMLIMRFYGNMTQSEIAAKYGISQMHVSRLLAQTLAYLRHCILDSAEAAGS